MSGLRRLLAVGVLALSTACGSTVQLVDQARSGPSAQPGADGLTTAQDGTTVTGPGPGARAPGTMSPRVDGRPSGPPGAPSGPRLPAPTGKDAGSVRGPLEIGFLYPDNGAANAALGVAVSADNSPRAIMNALVTALNRGGGAAGRALVVRHYSFDSTSSDYAAQAAAACTYFTQDRPVPVVVDLAFGNRFGMASCLAERGVVDIGLATSDTVADNQVGLFAAPSAMTSTRRYPAALSVLHGTGYVTSRNKLGVLVEDCPHLQRAYRQAVLPEISRLRLVLADTRQISCTDGFSSAGPASASVQSAVLQFRSRGVDRLLMVSDFEQVTLLLLANYAESQGWRPGYLLTSTAQTEVMRPNIAAGQWPQLRGAGWAPGLDIDDPREPPTRAEQRCLDLVKQGGVAVSGWQNRYVATAVCSAVFFLEAALARSRGDARGRQLMAAVHDLGSSFVAPGLVANRTSFGPARHDGPAAVAPFGYVQSCSCLRYVGRPVSVG